MQPDHREGELVPEYHISTVVNLTSDWGIGPALLCPHCYGDNLHHGRVTVFNRGQDDAVTTMTVVDHDLTATGPIPSAECDNPSSRRDGLAIAFCCEECGGGIALSIAQHKGSTFLAWRFTPEGRREE